MVEFFIVGIFAYAAGYEIAKRKFSMHCGAGEIECRQTEKDISSVVIKEESYEEKCIQT